MSQTGWTPVDDTSVWKPVTETAPTTKPEGFAHKVWSRLWEPVKASEVEKLPGLNPDRINADYQRFEIERAQGKHPGAVNPYEAGANWAGALATVDRAALKSFTDFFSPGQLAMRGLKPIGQFAAGGGFAAQQGYDLWQNWDHMGAAERSAALSGLVGGLLMTGIGAHGIATAKPVVKSKPLTIQDHLAYKYNVAPFGEDSNLYHFKDPMTGGSVAVKRQGFNELRMREAVQAHRERFAGQEPNADPIAVEHRARQNELNEAFRREYGERLPEKVGLLRHWLDQPIPAMRDSNVPEVERVADLISEAAKGRSVWVSNALKDYQSITKGFHSGRFGQWTGRSLEHVAELVDRWGAPQQGLGQTSNRDGGLFTTDEVRAAVAQRIQLLNIWEQLRAASGQQLGGFRLGFIQNYLPHLEKINMPERVLNSIKAELLGAQEDLPSRYTPEEPVVEKRGRMLSQFLLSRNRRIPDPKIEYNLNKILPSYLRSVSRVLFDRPAIFKAEEALRSLPENSTWRQYADAFLDKYTYKIHQGEYDTKTRRIVHGILNTTTRSVLGFSFHLQTLHLGRLWTTVWPQMKSRDFAFGLAKVARNPKAAYARAAEVGITPQTVPLRYMSGWRRFDSIANFLGGADFIDRSVAFEGQYHRYLRESLAPEAALTKAVQDAKDFSFLAAPESTPLAWGRGAGLGFGDAVSSAALQYKHIPASILYQYVKAMRGMGSDPVKAAKFTFALSSALLAEIYTGVHLVHFSTRLFTSMQPVVFSMAQRITQQIQAAWKAYEKGDERKFKQHLGRASEATLELFPGGMQVDRARRYGPKALLIDPSDAERKRMDRQYKNTHH